MINFLAVALATIMIPSISVNSMLTNTDFVEETSILQTFVNDITPYSNTAIIQTPNKTNVEVEIVSETINNIEYYTTFFENYTDLKPKIIGDATSTYNSHAYAWYMNWNSNYINCYLYNLQPFVDDKSFIKVTSPQEGDIIVYLMYYNGAYAPVHSGIVKSVLNEEPNYVCGDANTVMVESKWGIYGLYEHRGDLCPFTTKYNYFDVVADTVVYYRRHTHSYTDSYVNNGTNHTAKCACGEIITENHTYKYSYTFNSTYHTKKCKCGYSVNETHVFKVYNPKSALALIGANEDFFDLQALAGTKFQCTICGYVKSGGDDIALPIVPWD